MLSKANIQVVFMVVLLLLATYQDFPLVNTFGEIARSPIVFLTPFLLLYIFSHKEIIISKNLSYWLTYVVYLMIISVVALVVVNYVNSSLFVFYESLPIKTLKMLAYPIVGIIFYQFTYAYLKRLENPYRTLLNTFVLLQAFTLLWIVFEIYFLKKPILFLPEIHSVPAKYWRIRLWTLEESWTGTILILLIFFPIYFLYKQTVSKWKRFSVLFMSAALFLSYVAVSESKGFLLLTLICVLPLAVQFIAKNKTLRQIGVILGIFLIVAIVVAVINLQDVVSQQFTSITFGTRFTSVFAALDVFIHSIFGVGYSGFVYFYPQAIEKFIDAGVFDSFDLREIKTYLSTTKALSTKSEFFDNLIYGGIFFLYFFYKFYIQRYFYFLKIRKLEVFFLKIPLLFIILSGIVYITYHIKYEVWFFLAFLDFVQQKEYSDEQSE